VTVHVFVLIGAGWSTGNDVSRTQFPLCLLQHVFY